MGCRDLLLQLARLRSESGNKSRELGSEHAGAAVHAPDGIGPSPQLRAIFISAEHVIHYSFDSHAAERPSQLVARAAAARGQKPPPAAAGLGRRMLGRYVTWSEKTYGHECIYKTIITGYGGNQSSRSHRSQAHRMLVRLLGRRRVVFAGCGRLFYTRRRSSEELKLCRKTKITADK
jgi:hypothetical protein